MNKEAYNNIHNLDDYENSSLVNYTSDKTQVFLTIRKKGYFLRYVPGKNLQNEYTHFDLKILFVSRQLSNLTQLDLKKIIEELKENPGKNIKIKDNDKLQENAENDMRISLEVSEDSMEAHIYLSYSPSSNGRILELEEVLDFLKEKGIGENLINKKIILEALTYQKYNQAILVAEGTPPLKGENAYVNFEFNTENETGPLFSEDDENLLKKKVDYRISKGIQSVYANQLLARKYFAKKGKDGFDVYQKKIVAKLGEDFNIIKGANVELRPFDGGEDFYASSNGHPQFIKSELSVSPEYVIKGDVDFNVGNISFLGSIVVEGDVKDGFSIKTSGKIYVKGNVGNAKLESEDQIIVNGGIVGKRQYFIKAKGSIFAKFIENALIFTEKDLIIKENLMNSIVYAGSRVLCYGKKGVIIGGKIYAAYDVNARYIGSNAFTVTYVEVGIDPKYVLELKDLKSERQALEKEKKDLEYKIKLLKKRQKQNLLDQQQEEFLVNFEKLKTIFQDELINIISNIAKIKSYLSKLNIDAIVAVKETVYPGVFLQIRKANLNLKVEMKNLSFYEDKNMIKQKTYRPIEKNLEVS